MSKVVDGAVEALRNRLGGDGIDGSIRFVILEEGALRIDEHGVRAEDGEVAEADCTLIASRDVFEGILEGNVDPAGAFMSGRLKVEGDVALAFKLGTIVR